MNQGFNEVKNYEEITRVDGGFSPIDTSSLIDGGHVNNLLSPIDQFIENSNKINLIVSNASTHGPISKELGNIVFLGYISAVEGYFRSLIRALILVDERVRRNVEPRTVTYAAAIHHQREMLPEALMEGLSFASSYQVKDVLKDFIGIKGKNAFPKDVEKVLNEYKKICELRHCCVHRFGLLGSNNAIRLGIDTHRTALEKPICFDGSSLSQTAKTIRVFVKTMNNFIFGRVLYATAINKADDGGPLYSDNWSWNLNKDRRRFKNYYNIFASQLDSIPSPGLKKMYNDFRDSHK
jgi:hypothetical protein|tara:strand:- start:364 stop:1245 length:882 start_codon:yes stop_codon:yes gene_type:complete